MNPLITLSALTGPQNSRPAIIPVRPIEARDLPELTRMYRHAYADGPAHLHGGNPGWIGDLFDGIHGRPVAEASLVTATPDGRLTAAIITTDTTLGDEKSKVAFIAELFTDPGHRHQGPSPRPGSTGHTPTGVITRTPPVAHVGVAIDDA